MQSPPHRHRTQHRSIRKMQTRRSCLLRWQIGIVSRVSGRRPRVATRWILLWPRTPTQLRSASDKGARFLLQAKQHSHGRRFNSRKSRATLPLAARSRNASPQYYPPESVSRPVAATNAPYCSRVISERENPKRVESCTGRCGVSSTNQSSSPGVSASTDRLLSGG